MRRMPLYAPTGRSDASVLKVQLATPVPTRHPLGPLEFACDTRRCIVGGIHTSPSTLLVRADDVIGLQIMNQLGTSRSLTECEKYQLTRRSPARGISTEPLDSVL
jgi:hypothetical protein